MKDIFKYIPGFRTDKKWKKVIAIIYYIFCLFMLLAGVGAFLILASIPFIGFAILSLIKHRNKAVVLTLVAGIIMFSIGVKVQPTTSENTTASSIKEVAASKVTPEVKTKTPEEIKKEADAKAKVDAEAKIKAEASEKATAAQKIKDVAAAEAKVKADAEAKIKLQANGELKVHYIDVGQADSILVQQGNSSMLIDAGNNGDAQTIKGYLDSQGVKALDVVIGTHVHEDHIGSMDYIINSFKVGKVFFPKQTSTTNTFKDFVSSVKNKGLNLIVPPVGSTFKIGDATVTVLAPNGSGYEDPNDYSIVVKVTYGTTSFLLTGDAEADSESQMLSKGLDLSATVLKIGHHGSKSSTGQSFLDKVNPKYAVISVGKGNSFT